MVAARSRRRPSGPTTCMRLRAARSLQQLACIWFAGALLLVEAHILAPPPPPGSLLGAAVRDVLARSTTAMKKLNTTGVPTLETIFNNTFTFTAAQTWQDFHDGTVFIDTGDIQQQWLRDSCNQMRPYLELSTASEPVAGVFVRSLQRMVRFYASDRYASAFNPYEQPQYDQCPKTLECLNCTCADCAPACANHSYQHAYEPDSFCWVIDLAHRFWAASAQAAAPALDAAFHDALWTWIHQLQDEQDHLNRSPYRSGEGGSPPPTAHVGLLWGGARPSDDKEKYHYNIPDNMFAVVALTKAAQLASAVFEDESLATACTEMRDSVEAAIQAHGVFEGNLTVPRMYAFEVDGFGHQLLIDDANMPNLLAIPYLGYPDAAGLYNNTRAFSLRPQHNPYDGECFLQPHLCHGNRNYFVGSVARGLGSQHQSHYLRPVNKGIECHGDCIWPLGLIMEALTVGTTVSTDDPSSAERALARERAILCTLLKTNDGQLYMHEGFDKENSTWYNRDLFGWANALFSHWLLSSDAFPLANPAALPALQNGSFCPDIPPPAKPPGPPPPPVGPPTCESELKLLCGSAKPKGLAACLLCTALHQPELKLMGCSQANCDAYCQGAPPAPAPAATPAPRNEAEAVGAVEALLEARCGSARRAGQKECLVCVSLRHPAGGCATAAAAAAGGGLSAESALLARPSADDGGGAGATAVEDDGAACARAGRAYCDGAGS